VASVDQAFRQFLTRIELNAARVGLASQRYNAVKEHVEATLTGATVRQIGSFQKNTKIRPLDLSEHLDVDGLVILGQARTIGPAGGSGLTTTAALSRVEDALRGAKTYRLMRPTIDAPTVTLEYADGFRMELAVGYEDWTGLRPRAQGPVPYLVAGKLDWLPADYDFDAQFITYLNGLPIHEGAIVPVIKLAKRYFRTTGVPLNSFHTEVLVCLTLPSAIADWVAKRQRWGYHHALAAVLSLASPLMISGLTLPNSYSPPVTSNLPADELRQVGVFLKKAGVLAWNICSESDAEVAIERWRTFFGDPFPPSGSLGR